MSSIKSEAASPQREESSQDGEERLASLPPFMCRKYEAVKPGNLGSVLPKYSPGLPSILRPPIKDCILVGLDFGYLNQSKVYESREGTQSRFNPEVEYGLAELDVRALVENGGVPDDRGHAFFSKIRSQHHIIEEYKGDLSLHLTNPYHFAYGRSKILPANELARCLHRQIRALSTRRLTKTDRSQGVERSLIFLTWNAPSVENTLERLGMTWIKWPNVQVWDLQISDEFRLRFDQEYLKCEYLMETMGLRHLDQVKGNLANCAGNRAVFFLQIALAFFYMDGNQRTQFQSWQEIPFLRHTWIGRPLDQLNIPPGEEPTPRLPSQRNDPLVSQRRTERFYRV